MIAALLAVLLGTASAQVCADVDACRGELREVEELLIRACAAGELRSCRAAAWAAAPGGARDRDLWAGWSAELDCERGDVDACLRAAARAQSLGRHRAAAALAQAACAGGHAGACAGATALFPMTLKTTPGQIWVGKRQIPACGESEGGSRFSCIGGEVRKAQDDRRAYLHGTGLQQVPRVRVLSAPATFGELRPLLAALEDADFDDFELADTEGSWWPVRRPQQAMAEELDAGRPTGIAQVKTLVGSGGADGIDAAIRARLPDVRACYEDQLRTDRQAAGRLAIVFTVEPGGAVSDVTAEIDEVGIGACASRVIRGIRFPPNPLGMAVAVTYPFVFSPPAWSAPNNWPEHLLPWAAVGRGLAPAAEAASAACYRPDDDPDRLMFGLVDLGFVVEVDGRVRDVVVTRSELGNHDVSQCIAEQLDGVRLEPAPPEPVRGLWWFQFEPPP